MIFGRLTLDQAEGAILAHTTRLSDGVLAKGAVLTPQVLARLDAAGHTQVTAALLEPGDVEENEAARVLADALTVAGLIATPPRTGRANLSAAYAGLFRADATGVDAINLLHEGITVAHAARRDAGVRRRSAGNGKNHPVRRPRCSAGRGAGSGPRPPDAAAGSISTAADRPGADRTARD
ncbi:MAG: hypothetical protein WDN04_15675 [Rhodospirillales bacterium]